MAEYQVSRNTVRQAIELLIKDGLIVRRHGFGTYVSGLSQTFHYKLDAFYENVDLLRRAGYQSVTIQHLAVERLASPLRIQEALQLETGEEVVCFTKLFVTEERTAMFTRDYLPARWFGPDDLTNSSDTYLEFLEAHTSQRVEYVLLDILPVNAEGRIAAAFDCPPGTPLLLCEELFLDRSQNRPLAFGQNYLHPAMSSLRLLTQRA
jgi:DNA-binding GntR family transcriptional regulator